MSVQVSCIVAASRNTATFVAQALRYYQAQSLASGSREMIIVGPQNPGSLPSGVSFYSNSGTMGDKLNVAASHAQANLILKWDDDDWYGPTFLADALNNFPSSAWLTNYQALSAYLTLTRDGVVRQMGPQYWAGGTLLFHKSLWQAAGFRPLNRLVDGWFATDHSQTLYQWANSKQFLQTRHGANTWQTIKGMQTDAFLETFPASSPLSQIVTDPTDLAFLQSLKG